MMKNEIQYLLNTGSCSNHKFVCPQGPCGDSEGCDRFIPIFGGAHNRFNKYEECTLVYDPETLVAYISKRCVPTGVEITNRKYWQPMNVSGYADDNIIIFSDRNQAGQLTPYTLETAVPCVEISGRKNGTIISFYSTTNIPHWEIWQYQNSDTCHWEELQYWKLVTNIYNKFVGWYNNLDELESIPVNDRVGKYALIGDDIDSLTIYEGTRNGWIALDINIYQKFLDNFLKLLDEEKITLTECQEEILREWLKKIGCCKDCDGGNADWGWAGRPYTLFEVKAAFECESDLKLTYPTSIFHDASDEEAVGQTALHSITVDNEDIADLDLKFTAGAWHDITNGEDIYLTDDKDTEGYLDITFDNAPSNLQIKIDNASVKPFTNSYKVPCDGGTHVITIIKPNTVRVQLNYYNSATSMIKTKTIEVPYGSTMEEPVITDAAYVGHAFVGWATNQSLSTDPNNYFDVVGRTTEGPSYFDFDTELIEDMFLYAWYNIEATFKWTDNGGQKEATRNAAYYSNITDAPIVGEYTGYTFQGWQFGTATIPAGQPIGPITKPVIITGLYQPNVVIYNYKMINSTGYPITVTVGSEEISLAVGQTKTVSLQGSEYARAVVKITTGVPTAPNTNYAWTINSTEGYTKTVNNGTVTLGLNTTYNYKINNNSGQSPITVTVGSQTKNVTTSNTFVVSSNSNTVSVGTTAPEGYLWVIGNTTGASLDNVAPGTTAISLEVDPSVRRSEDAELYPDGNTDAGVTGEHFTWGINMAKYIAADFRDSDLQFAIYGRLRFNSNDILSAEVSYNATPTIKFYLEPPANYGSSGLTLDNEVTSQITLTPDRARFLIDSHIAADNLPPVDNEFEFSDYYLQHDMVDDCTYISYIELEIFYNLNLSNLTAPAGHSLDEYNLVATVDGQYYYDWDATEFYATGYNYLKEE